MRRLGVCAGFVALAVASSVGAAEYIDGKPLNQVVSEDVRACRSGIDVTMPIIAWGADGVTIHANGNALSTEAGLFEDAGWDVTLEVVDDFAEQVRRYMRCDSPFLRGTLGMLMAAAPVTEANSQTELQVIYKHSWSAGDGIVGAAGIRNVQDLRGKKIAIQAYGPHVDFVGRILADSGLSFDDVTVVWTQDLTGESASTPVQALVDGEVDAAAMILPDARTLTSGGAVGTGAEGSVKGATILFSTQEAAAVIADYIAVRKDFLDANRSDVEAMVAALFKAEERMRQFMADPQEPRRATLAALMAEELLGGLPPEEGVFLWQDAITDGWVGNVSHFTNEADPRGFGELTREVNIALRGAGILEQPFELSHAGWTYSEMADGLESVSERQIAAFDPDAAAKAVTDLRKQGLIEDATKIEFRVFFEPDSQRFPADLYEDDFTEMLRLAATYSGAIITLEGHADPLHFLRREKEGADPKELRAIRTAGRNLSLERSQALLQALEAYATGAGVAINVDQFTLDGIGIAAPEHNPPKTEQEWRANMRVVVRVLTTQAEATTFNPL
ncbi:MAG: ABC transporter substrate-binding protein [Pseudomonadota bacterium]